MQSSERSEMPGKIYAVIDTNVIVSALFALNGSSNPAQVIRKVIDGTIVPLYNEQIISEYYEVLTRDKFPFKISDIEYVMKIFTKYGLSLEGTTPTEESIPDKDDIVFYEVAFSKDGSYLVTGNIRHFPKKAFIVTPAEMMQIIKTMEHSDPKLLNDPQGPYGSLDASIKA